jgi:hypothetical protein
MMMAFEVTTVTVLLALSDAEPLATVKETVLDPAVV